MDDQQNDLCKDHEHQKNNILSFEGLLMDDMIPLPSNMENDNENLINKSCKKTTIGSNVLNISGKKQRFEPKKTQLFNLYFNTLQTKGSIDNNKFLAQVDGNNRRMLGQINSVLEYFGIIKKNRSIVTLCSSTLLDPPIKIKFLDEEIKKLENEVNELKQQISVNQLNGSPTLE